jgi:hypothetical protein
MIKLPESVSCKDRVSRIEGRTDLSGQSQWRRRQVHRAAVAVQKLKKIFLKFLSGNVSLDLNVRKISLPLKMDLLH